MTIHVDDAKMQEALANPWVALYLSHTMGWPMADMIRCGLRLKGLTLSDVARSAEVSPGMVTRVLQGTKVSNPVYRALAKALGWTIEALRSILERAQELELAKAA